MKVLLISDDKKNLELLNRELCKNGYETIIYHWLLKALDNMEEISPDFCIVSVPDYPRHWKILAQFVKSGFLRNPCSVILFSPGKFSEEENKKAAALRISGIFDSVDENGMKVLFSLLKKNDEKNIEKQNSITEKTGNVEKTGKKSLLARIEAMNNEKQKS